MFPHLVLIERAVSRLFSICKCCGKGHCEKATVGSRGDRRQQGGTRYGCDIWSGGTNYSAVHSPGGPLSRGDCPRRDRNTYPERGVGGETVLLLVGKGVSSFKRVICGGSSVAFTVSTSG